MTEDNQGPSEYSHHKCFGDIDKMNKDLEQLKEDIFKAKVQTHILHVDLATQFSPHMVEKLKNVKEDCKRCSLTVNKLSGSEQGSEEK